MGDKLETTLYIIIGFGGAFVFFVMLGIAVETYLEGVDFSNYEKDEQEITDDQISK